MIGPILCLIYLLTYSYIKST